MDTFHGCYKESPRDLRHFAALYLAVRFFSLLIYLLFNGDNVVPAAAILFLSTLVLMSIFRPYKSKRSNVVDIVMLLALITIAMCSCIKTATMKTQVTFANFFTATFYFITVLIPPCYVSLLILLQVYPVILKCFSRGREFALKARSKFKIGTKVEDQAILTCVGADYQACH